MPTKKKYPAVLVRFEGPDAQLKKKVVRLAAQHGISASKVVAMSVRLGLPLVKKNLDGLLQEETIEE